MIYEGATVRHHNQLLMSAGKPGIVSEIYHCYCNECHGELVAKVSYDNNPKYFCVWPLDQWEIVTDQLDPDIRAQQHAATINDADTFGYSCSCGQMLTFGDHVYGTDTLYDCPTCGTRHDTDPDIRAQQHADDEATLADMICDTCDCDPCACDDEPTWAGEVTGYDNGPTFW